MNVDTFLNRLPATAASERELVTAAFGITENLKRKAADIRANTRLSTIGQAEEIKKLASGSFVGHFKQLQDRAAAMSADVANLKKSFVPKTPDRSDLFGEMQRRELRDWMRSLPPAERFRAAAEDDAIAAAVIDVMPALSGLTREQHDQLRQQHLDRHFGPQMAGLAKREEVLENLTAAIAVAKIQLRSESGLSDEEIG